MPPALAAAEVATTPSAARSVWASPLYRGATLALFLSGLGTSAAAPQITLFLVNDLHVSLTVHDDLQTTQGRRDRRSAGSDIGRAPGRAVRRSGAVWATVTVSPVGAPGTPAPEPRIGHLGRSVPACSATM